MTFLFISSGAPAKAPAKIRTQSPPEVYLDLDPKVWQQTPTENLLKRTALLVTEKAGSRRGFVMTDFIQLNGADFDPNKGKEHCKSQADFSSSQDLKYFSSESLPQAHICQFSKNENDRRYSFTLVYFSVPSTNGLVKVTSLVFSEAAPSRAVASSGLDDEISQALRWRKP